MFKLYEISDEILKCLGEEIPEEDMRDTLEGLAMEWQAKAEAVAKYILNLQAESDAIQAAIERMSARQKAVDKKIHKLKEYLQEEMEVTGLQVKTPEITVKLRKNPPSVAIDNEVLVPDEYKASVITTKILKAQILKSSVPVPGTRIVHGTRLEIK
jgi:predicted transcriptional regulator